MLQYRKEIDGLRAIAVLSVILFHGGFIGFNGGYIGVDIFFVISGYLITSIILEDMNKNKFSIINFYERRARRILPALSIVLLFTTVAAYILMPAYLLKLYSQSLVSTMTFSSNIYFYLTSGYFSTASDEMPLLHTWSLSVEEQYYLFFPLIIILLWSLGKKWLLPSIFLLTTASLIFAQFLSLKNVVDANFYLIFSRAWELLFGSIIAFIPLYKLDISELKKELLGILGLLLIIYSIVFFNKQTPFPSLYTLIPVLGTCLIIIFVNSKSYVGSFLTSKILVSIGLISYSLYLWHQPLFAFLRLKVIGEPSIYMFTGAIICSFVLAFFSWKYVEKPFRNKIGIFKRTSVFIYSSVSIVVFISIGFTGHFYNGFIQRFDSTNYASSIKFSPKRNECHTKGNDYLQPINACKYFGKNITWASFGDSHTVELAHSLARRLEDYNTGLAQLSFSGCSPSLLFEARQPGCTKWLNESLEYLENNTTIKNVLLGFRYSTYLYGNHLASYPGLPNIDPSINFTDSFQNLDSKNLKEIYWKSLNEIVSRLLKANKNVYILYPIPELPINIKKMVMPFSVFENNTILNLERTTSKEYYSNRNRFIMNKLDSLEYGEKLHSVKPFDILCDGDFCPAVKNNKALYFDDNHLSIYGSELIVNNIDLEGENIYENY